MVIDLLCDELLRCRVHGLSQIYAIVDIVSARTMHRFASSTLKPFSLADARPSVPLLLRGGRWRR